MAESDNGCPSCAEFLKDSLPPCPLACMSDKCKEIRKPVVNVHHKPVIWVLGGPGCGKGTQCKKIQDNFGFTHLSTGDLLRAEIKSGSERSKCLQNIMARGGLVPNDIVLNLVREEMKKLEPIVKGYLIDGYPREKNQGKAFEKAVSPVTKVIYFKLSPDTMLKRLQYRAANAEVVRFDDHEDVFRLRIDTFLHNNSYILEQYKDKMHTVNAEGVEEEVYAELQKYISPILEQATIAFAAHSAAIKKATEGKLAPASSAKPASPNPKSVTPKPIISTAPPSAASAKSETDK